MLFDEFENDNAVTELEKVEKQHNRNVTINGVSYKMGTLGII